MNKLLPADIAVLEVTPVGPRFHAPHHCLARSYLYRLHDSKNVFGRRYAWRLARPIDAERMHRAAAIFTGMHNAAFAEKQELKKSTKVLIGRAAIIRQDRLVTVRECRFPFFLAHGAAHDGDSGGGRWRSHGTGSSAAFS